MIPLLRDSYRYILLHIGNTKIEPCSMTFDKMQLFQALLMNERCGRHTL